MTKYRTIVADPPWAYREKVSMGSGAKHKGPDRHYQTMPLNWILGLPVESLAEDNAHLYLWTTNTFLTEAHDVASSWGFTPRTMLTWVKSGLGTGPFFRVNTEHVLFCLRGKLPVARHDQPTAFSWPRQPHSQKPDAFYDLVESMSPGPYLEMFSRRHRFFWDVWGNESANTATLEVPA